MNKLFTILLLSLLLLSCQNNRSNVKWNSDEIIAIGKTKDTTYIWCGITPKEDKYSYRIGKWEFTMKDSLKIASGEYDVFLNWIWDKGGCPYEYFENSIDLEKWEFWNLNGDKTELTENHLKLIEFRVKEEKIIE